MPKADRHQAQADKVHMGIDEQMRVRLGQPLRKQLKTLYTRIYRGLPQPPLTKFIGFCLALGIDELNARYPEESKIRR